METFELVWPVVVGSVISPVTTWIKSKLPQDFPVQAALISLVLSGLAAWGLSAIFAPEMTLQQVVSWALTVQVGSQLTHSIVKTRKESLL